jgi:fumarate reductase iron-sulfur subunit
VAGDDGLTLGTAEMRVFRYNPTGGARGFEGEFQTVDVPFGEQTTLVDALTWIKDTVDSTLAFRVSCRMGVCGSCGVMVDGRPRLACETALRDLPRSFTVEPLAHLDVERDLVVDKEPFLDALRSVQPWMVAAGEGSTRSCDSRSASAQDDGGRSPARDAEGQAPTPSGHPAGEAGGLASQDLPSRQTPAQMVDYATFAECVNCLLCYAACPQVGFEKDFLGPAAITTAMRYNRDSRDSGSGSRLPVLDREDGIWPCTFVGACSTVCPKGVDPASAVQLAKISATISWAQEFVAPHAVASPREES